MGRAKKICISVVIMIILAILIVFLVSYFIKDEKDTYEGVLVENTYVYSSL